MGIYACVRILAESIAGLPLHVYKYRGNGKERVRVASFYAAFIIIYGILYFEFKDCLYLFPIIKPSTERKRFYEQENYYSRCYEYYDVKCRSCLCSYFASPR